MDEIKVTFTVDELNAILLAIVERRKLILRQVDQEVADSVRRKVCKALAEY